MIGITTSMFKEPKTLSDSNHESQGSHSSICRSSGASEEVAFHHKASAPSCSSSAALSRTNVHDTGNWMDAPGSEVTTEKFTEALEYQRLVLGPFEAGVKCEILEAWYGRRGDASRQTDATKDCRARWSSKLGLVLEPRDYYPLFGDPARMELKTMFVRYRLSGQTFDVSRGSYAEGFDRVSLLPIMTAKLVSNLFGATAAASALAVSKAINAVNPRETVADSQFFQMGFRAWLKANGISPSLSYEALGEPQRRVCEFPAEDMRQTPLIVANHICYLDGMILACYLGQPKVIAMAGTLKTPLIGSFASEIGVIEVERDNKDSRAQTLEAIQEHVANWRPGERPLLVFPEGFCSNGDTMQEFKKGAFVPGVPVRPVLLMYTGKWHPANVNFKVNQSGEIEPTDDGDWVKEFMGNLVHSLQIQVLAPYDPSDAERKDPLQYAANVRTVMAKAYEQMRADLPQRRAEEEQNSWQAVARRNSVQTYEEVQRFIKKFTCDTSRDGQPAVPPSGVGVEEPWRRQTTPVGQSSRAKTEVRRQRRSALHAPLPRRARVIKDDAADDQTEEEEEQMQWALGASIAEAEAQKEHAIQRGS